MLPWNDGNVVAETDIQILVDSLKLPTGRCSLVSQSRCVWVCARVNVRIYSQARFCGHSDAAFTRHYGRGIDQMQARRLSHSAPPIGWP